MIYTANCGVYDQERTDVKVFTKEIFKNPRLSAKIYKCLPHLFMKKEWWLWIDANIFLKDGALKKLISLAESSDVVVFENPYRRTVGEEKKEIKRLKLDDPKIVDSLDYDDSLRLPSCNLIMRRNIPEVRMSNEKWCAEICAGSQRDQLSFSTCFKSVKYINKLEPFDNEYFVKKGHIKPR
jgi:GT2 family glycosyltransferase